MLLPHWLILYIGIYYFFTGLYFIQEYITTPLAYTLYRNILLDHRPMLYIGILLYHWPILDIGILLNQWLILYTNLYYNTIGMQFVRTILAYT